VQHPLVGAFSYFCAAVNTIVQAHPAIDQTAYMDARQKYRKTACTSLPEDGHLDVSKHVEDTIIKLKL
jgi:hypothetical protein